MLFAVLIEGVCSW